MMNSKGMKLLLLSVVIVGLLALAVLLAAAPSAMAAEGGSSNYLPGLYGDFGVAVMPDPDFYFRNDLYYYKADANKERFVEGAQLRAELDADTVAYLATGFMVLDKKFLGGRYAFGADLPIIYTNLSGKVVLEPEAISFDESGVKIGDPGVIPISLFWSFGNFYLNAYESIIVPIGAYDKNEAINGGLNYWSFDTNLAATYLNPNNGFEISADVGYIYNTKNDATDYQTGQEFHLDYMLNLFLSEAFALGLQGYYYHQVTGDSGSGAILGDFKGEAAAIGPALMWATQIKDVGLTLSAKWLHEFQAEHRLQGDNMYLNLTFAF